MQEVVGGHSVRSIFHHFCELLDCGHKAVSLLDQLAVLFDELANEGPPSLHVRSPRLRPARFRRKRASFILLKNICSSPSNFRNKKIPWRCLDFVGRSLLRFKITDNPQMMPGGRGVAT